MSKMSLSSVVDLQVGIRHAALVETLRKLRSTCWIVSAQGWHEQETSVKPPRFCRCCSRGALKPSPLCFSIHEAGRVTRSRSERFANERGQHTLYHG